MTPEERTELAKRFAAIVLGYDGVSDEPPPIDTELGALNAVAEHFARWDWPVELYQRLVFQRPLQEGRR